MLDRFLLLQPANLKLNFVPGAFHGTWAKETAHLCDAIWECDYCIASGQRDEAATRGKDLAAKEREGRESG